MAGTHVYGYDKNDEFVEVEGVSKIEWELGGDRVRGLATAVITVRDIPLVATGFEQNDDRDLPF